MLPAAHRQHHPERGRDRRHAGRPPPGVRRSDTSPSRARRRTPVLAQIRQDRHLGAWNVYCALYGSPGTGRGQLEDRHRDHQARPARAASSRRKRPATPAVQYRAQLMSGVPNLQEFGLYNWRGAAARCGLRRSPGARQRCDKQYALAKKILNKHGLDYVGEFIVGWRDMHHVIDVLYDRTSEEKPGAPTPASTSCSTSSRRKATPSTASTPRSRSASREPTAGQARGRAQDQSARARPRTASGAGQVRHRHLTPPGAAGSPRTPAARACALACRPRPRRRSRPRSTAR